MDVSPLALSEPPGPDSAPPRRHHGLAFVLQEPGLKPGEEGQGVVAEDLAADAVGMVLAKVAAIDLLGEYFGEAATG